MNGLEALHADSPIREYMNWMAHTGNEPLYEEKYASLVAAQAGEKPCFLSVIIRTQGKRLDMLQDVLLSLWAQTDQDFEVIVICHRAEEANAQAVRTLLASQGETAAEKIRCLSLNEGQRGAPINLGFAVARGEYAVCLDDDDLVFDHWTACFHEAAQTQRGKILHAYVLTQPWQVRLRNGRQYVMAAGRAEHTYCVPYQTIVQQSKNMCPFMGLAFPLYLFREMHILFDEQLTTIEDWEYLLRTAGIAGVWDIPEPTAIYRLWDAQDASRQMYRTEEWKQNYIQVGERMKQVPLLIPSSEAADYRTMLMGLQDDEVDKGRASFLNIGLLFWSDGSPFTDRYHITAPVSYGKNRIRICFELPSDEDRTHIRRIRIDPARAGLFTLSDITVALTCDDGTTETLTTDSLIGSNGVIEKGSVFFLTEDPMLTFSVNVPGALSRIELRAELSYRCPEVVQHWVSQVCADANWMAENTNRARLYLNHGSGYRDEQCLLCEPVFRGSDYRAVFTLAPEQAEGLQELRFDPTEAGMLWLDALCMRLTYAGGRQVALKAGECGWFNGFATSTGAAFIDSNPYIFLPVDASDPLTQVEVTARMEFVNARQMERLFAQATCVPDYALLCAQLNHLRQKQ